MKYSEFIAHTNLPTSANTNDFFGPFQLGGEWDSKKLNAYLRSAATRFANYADAMSIKIDDDADVKFMRAAAAEIGMAVWIKIIDKDGETLYVANRKAVAKADVTNADEMINAEPKANVAKVKRAKKSTKVEKAPETNTNAVADDGRHADGKGWTNKKLQGELIAKA